MEVDEKEEIKRDLAQPELLSHDDLLHILQDVSSANHYILECHGKWMKTFCMSDNSRFARPVHNTLLCDAMIPSKDKYLLT